VPYQIVIIPYTICSEQVDIIMLAIFNHRSERIFQQIKLQIAFCLAIMLSYFVNYYYYYEN